MLDKENNQTTTEILPLPDGGIVPTPSVSL